MSLFNEMMKDQGRKGNNALMSVDDVINVYGPDSGGDLSAIELGNSQSRFSRPDRGKGLSDNMLRPTSLDEFIGQKDQVDKLRKHIAASLTRNRPLLHCLLAAKGGTGKTTLAHIVGHEMGTTVHVVQCPVHSDTLLAMAAGMKDGDILVLDEVHLQARSRTPQAGPEVIYNIMEDGRLLSHQGQVVYPEITVIGATTDAGMLPDSFLDRFPLKVNFEEYSTEDMAKIATLNAKQLETDITKDAAMTFAGACLGVPREINNMVKQAAVIADALGQEKIDGAMALDVLKDEGREIDGLTRLMVQYLEALWERRRWVTKAEEWVAKASLKTMAHLIGRARDVKYVEMTVEPTLIRRNYIEIEGGRRLTPQGMARIGVKFPPPPAVAAAGGKPDAKKNIR